MPRHDVEVEIVNRLGLHARAAAKLVELVSGFSSEIKLGKDERLVDARSIMALLMMGAGKGTRLRLCVEGKDADDAVAAVCDLFARRFDEPD